MGDPSNADIMRELGGLTADAVNAKESRRVMHEKLEAQSGLLGETARALGKVEYALQITTEVAVQARDRIIRFEDDFHQTQVPIITAAAATAERAAQFKIEAEPILGTMKMVRNIVLALLGLGVLSAGSLITMAITAREWLAVGIRWVLGI